MKTTIIEIYIYLISIHWFFELVGFLWNAKENRGLKMREAYRQFDGYLWESK